MLGIFGELGGLFFGIFGLGGIILLCLLVLYMFGLPPFKSKFRNGKNSEQ